MTEPADKAATGIVVQKFGGTSVGSPEGRAALCDRVKDRVSTGDRVVVVVSAMGRVGAPYATDTLLSLLDGHDVDERESDLLAACGEVVSAVVIAHELRAAGVAATAVTGAGAGILTDGRFGDAEILAIDASPLLAVLESGAVPVVTGFQGVAANGELTTLGRGGSDTTACALGAALGATAIEVYTDVDGVMTADPRACGGVRVLDSLRFEELFQMAMSGARVMHAPAAETAMGAGVPVWVRNTHGQGPGTLVSDTEGITATRRDRVATAVTHVDGIVRITVALPEARNAAVTRVFRQMADAGVSLDMFTPLGDSLAMSFGDGQLERAMSVLDQLGMARSVERDLAKVTLVGAGMHGVPGVMARVAEALSKADVEMLQVADSHYTISVLVHQISSRTAIAALHEAFGLGA